jgi:hypothetical protein
MSKSEMVPPSRAAEATTAVERVVIYQFGAFCVMTPAQYAEALSAALRDEPWIIPGRQMKRRPKWISSHKLPGEEGLVECLWARDAATIYAEMPCDWERDEIVARAWELYDALGDDAARTFPLCPWCGFDCAMARNNPVPLKVEAERTIGGMATALCADCEKQFVLSHDGWEELPGE